MNLNKENIQSKDTMQYYKRNNSKSQRYFSQQGGDMRERGGQETCLKYLQVCEVEDS